MLSTEGTDGCGVTGVPGDSTNGTGDREVSGEVTISPSPSSVGIVSSTVASSAEKCIGGGSQFTCDSLLGISLSVGPVQTCS